MHTRLEPVKMDWSKRVPCQSKTCLAAIQLVTDWVFDASGDKTNVLWLHGLAGSGKSTLSTTIANFFVELKRLGAFVFFDRDVKERSDPFSVVRTLAYELSLFDSRIRDRVMRAIDENAHIARMQLDAQFRELLKQPLESAAAISQEGPIVIIIDALDECGSAADRTRLLSLLAKETAQLPSAIRIVITSRAEPDIESAFQRSPTIHIQELQVSPDNVDISIYIRQQMSEIAEKNYLPEDWPGEEKILALVERAAGLFIWASTACKYIAGYDPEQLVDDLVGGNVYADVEVALDVLYIKALESSGDWKNPRFKNDCCAIFGLILVTKNPLSPDTIDRFLSLKSNRAISRLGSVLHHQGNTEPVRILHVSFRDFLSSRSRCNGPWFIDLVEHNQRLAKRCIEVLQSTFGDSIKFSKLTLDDDLEKQTLDEATSYACSFWIVHVLEMEGCPDASFGQQISDFLKVHVLHWLEAMSLLRRSRSTANLLERLLSWVKVSLYLLVESWTDK